MTEDEGSAMMALPGATFEITAVEPTIGGTGGDPLLKRLVELAKVGWEANLVLLSNGTLVRGRLISGVKFRAALADQLLESPETRATSMKNFDRIIARSVEADDPPTGPDDDGDAPEPRFIHLADVRIGLGADAAAVPFMRMRLPAVSAFWITTAEAKEAQGE